MLAYCQGRQMSLEDELKLSAWQKWEKHHVFPIKLLLHILLVACGTYLVTAHNQVHGVTHRTIGQDFGRMFFPDNYAQYNGDAADNPQNRFFFFTMDDFNSTVNLLMSRYWALPSLSLTPTEIASIAGGAAAAAEGIGGDYYSYDDGDSPAAVPYPVAHYTYLTIPQANLLNTYAHDAINIETVDMVMTDPSMVFPFSWNVDDDMNDTSTSTISTTTTSTTTNPYAGNTSALKAFCASLVSITYDLHFRVHDPLCADSSSVSFFNARACYEWQALFTFDFHARHHFEVTWQYAALQRCPSDASSVNGYVATITVLTLLLAIVHESLTFIAVWKWTRMFIRAYMAQPALQYGGVAGWIALNFLGFREYEIEDDFMTANEQKQKKKKKKEKNSETSSSDDSTQGPDYIALQSSDESSNNINANGNSSSSSSSSPPLLPQQQRLKVRDVLRLLRPWLVLATIGVVLVSVHAGILLGSNFDITSGRGQEPILGLGCSALWLSLMRYLDISPKFYSTVLTLRASLPKIGRFLIGAIPIFVAFGLFAVIVFGTHAVRYADPTTAYMTLFAFINGDALRETYTHTEGRSSPVSSTIARANRQGGDGLTDYWWGNNGVSRGGWAYGFSFYTIVGDLHLVLITLTFMYVVINCCIALVEEAFFDTRSAEGEAILAALKEKDAAFRRRIAAEGGEQKHDVRR